MTWGMAQQLRVDIVGAMTDETAALAEASDPTTTPERLRELANGDSTAVRTAALSNPKFDIREVSQWIGTNDPNVSESAVDAVIARGPEFQYVMWDEPKVMELVPLRLMDTENGKYVIDDATFKAFMTGWNTATAQRVDFDRQHRGTIVETYLNDARP